MKLKAPISVMDVSLIATFLIEEHTGKGISASRARNILTPESVALIDFQISILLRCLHVTPTICNIASSQTWKWVIIFKINFNSFWFKFWQACKKQEQSVLFVKIKVNVSVAMIN